jgi:hypothetical protein
LVLALKISGYLVFDGQALHGKNAWSYGWQWGLAFLLTGLFEESLLRGYLQFTLTRGIGFWWAALQLSLGFGVTHLPNHGESPIGILAVVAVGLVFCLSLTGRLAYTPDGIGRSPTSMACPTAARLPADTCSQLTLPADCFGVAALRDRKAASM